MSNTKGYIIKTYKHRYQYRLSCLVGRAIQAYTRLNDGKIRIKDYRGFLQDVEAYKNLNEIYLHIARLKKPSFFVLHHNVYKNPQRMMEVARLEHELGWRSTFFVPDIPELLNKEIAQELWAMKHDLGLIYDCLETAVSEGIGQSEREIKRIAWLKFKNTLCRNLALNITCVVADKRPFGADNTLLWRENSFRQMQVRCDAEMDLRDEDVVFFHITGNRVQYLMRLREGGYRNIRKDLNIDGVKDLGKRLKAGSLVDRMIVQMEWM